MSIRSVILSIDFESKFEGLGDDGAGVWQSVLSVFQDDRDASFWVANFGFPWGEYLELEPVTVGSVKDRDYFYPEVFSRDQLEDDRVRVGFYVDNEAQILYIKPSFERYWWTRPALDYGQSRRFIDHAQVLPEIGIPVQSYIDGLFCEPRLIADSLSYDNDADNLEENRMNFNACNASLINGDGDLDNAREEIIGRGMRIFLGFSDDIRPFFSLIQYEEIFNGVVANVSFPNGDTVNIRGEDPRKYWEKNINPGVMTVDEFPFMDPAKEDTIKPISLGIVRKIPLINVSSEAAGNDKSRTWYIGSERLGLATAVELYEADDPDPYGGAWSQTPGTNLIVLGQKPTGTMYADVIGGSVVSPVTGIQSINAVDVALYLLGEYANLPYLSSFFDQSAIEIVHSRAPDLSIYQSTPLKLKDAIDRALSSANIRIFQKGIQSSDGAVRQLYSMRDLKIDGFEPDENLATITGNEVLSLPLPWEFDEESFASSIKVEYDKDYRADQYREITLTYDELKALQNHPIPRRYDYVAYLYDELDAERLAGERYEEYIKVPYRLSGQTAEIVGFDLLDYVFYTHQRTADQWILNPAIWRVTSVNKLQQTFKLALYEESVPVRISTVSGKMYGPFHDAYLNNQNSAYGSMKVDSRIDYVFGGTP